MPNAPKMVWSVCDCCKCPYHVARKDLRKGRRFCSKACSHRGKEVVARFQVGAENPNWKGGKTKHSKGYIYRYAPLHPRSHNGYVLEHILIMEEVLGRRLRCGEVVHHRDGNRSNNTPENLGLFTSIGEHTRYHAKRRHGIYMKGA